MILDTSDTAFTAAALSWLGSLTNDVVRRWDRVVDASPGYYPTTLHELWTRELEKRGLTPTEPSLPAERMVLLPPGHPLDYDWRFTEATRGELTARIAALTNPGDQVVYFGTPTLFAHAIMELVDRSHLLVDANASMVGALQRVVGKDSVIALTIGSDSLPPTLKAHTLVLDPPWYPEDSFAFLASGASVIRPGGRVLISQPTFATRPGVAEERRELVAAAERLGLSLVCVSGERLRYSTPHFERLSLAATLPTAMVRDDWRSGDLLIFERTDDVISIGAPPNPTPDAKWIERSFGPVRIKLRSAGGRDLGRVARGLDRLHTVSRRDTLREKVGLWTSGNRVRSLVSVDAVARLIELCEHDLAHMNFTHKNARVHAAALSLNTRVADHLFEILLLEYQEHIAGGYGVNL